MLNKGLGMKYMDDVCPECAKKIEEATAKLSKWALLNPIGVSKKFMKLLCSSCKRRLIKKVRKDGV